MKISLRFVKYALAGALVSTLFVGSGSPAFGQWKQSVGFSNVNGNNDMDNVAGFIPFQNYLIADARCAIDLMIGGTPDSLFASSDNGATWVSFGPNGGIPLIVYANTALVGGAEPSSSDYNITDEVLSYSSDGQTWVPDNANWPVQAGIPNSLVTIGNTIYVATAVGVFQQTAPGTAWTADTTGVDVGYNGISEIGLVFAANGDLYLSTFGGGILESKNGGSTWAAANNGLPTYMSNGFQVQQTSLIFGANGSSVYVLHATDSTGTLFDFFRTTNNGQSWSKVNNSLLGWCDLTTQIAFSGNDVFAVSDSGFYASTDNGATWNQADQGLVNFNGDYPTCVQTSGPNIVIGTESHGAWTRKLSDFAGSSVAEKPLAPSVTLSECYPNPVTSSSTIQYSLPMSGNVSLKLYDITGREVALLADGFQSEGQHSAKFDGSQFPAGTYYYRLNAGGQTVGRAMQLVR